MKGNFSLAQLLATVGLAAVIALSTPGAASACSSKRVHILDQVCKHVINPPPPQPTPAPQPVSDADSTGDFLKDQARQVADQKIDGLAQKKIHDPALQQLAGSAAKAGVDAVLGTN
jgi:hypothetical protein